MSSEQVKSRARIESAGIRWGEEKKKEKKKKVTKIN